jgi:hypothetical protein
MWSYLALRTIAIAASGAFAVAVALSGVAKAVTDTVFKYSTPKNGWYGLSPMAFAPDGDASASGYTIPWPNYLALSNGRLEGCFNAGVNLPQGAKITAVTAWYRSDSSGSIRLYLDRSKVSDGTNAVVASLSSTDVSLARKAMNTAVPGSAVATVNNRDYVYSIGVCFERANDRYYAGRISYTYVNAGD